MLSAALFSLALGYYMGGSPHRVVHTGAEVASYRGKAEIGTAIGAASRHEVEVPANVASSRVRDSSTTARLECSLHAAASDGARTPMTMEVASNCLSESYSILIGERPSPQTLSLLLAQWALETARGAKMWGYNYGGLKARAGGIVLLTKEHFGREERKLGLRFRRYSTAREGAFDYLRTLRDGFPLAFAALRGGKAPAFAQALEQECYFSGSPKAYRLGLEKLADEYLQKVNQAY